MQLLCQVLSVAELLACLPVCFRSCRRDAYTGQFRIVSAISHGEFYGDNWLAGRGVGLTDDNAIAITQTGRFVLSVENAMLVVYEWSGSGMSMTWQRRCQLGAPDGYTFRTSE
jgi:hypothetical protein